MDKINTKMCRQKHDHMSLVESLSIEFSTKSTIQMLVDWGCDYSGDLTQADKIRINSYFHEAPEIEPQNFYGKKDYENY